MSNKGSHDELNNSQKSNEYEIFINRFISFYTLIGVTYLLFVKSYPECACPSFNTVSNKLLSTNTLLSTETNIHVNNTYESTDQYLSTDTLLSTNSNYSKTTSPMISSIGSKRTLLQTSNTTIRSVKRNYELIQNLYTMLPDGIVIMWHGLIGDIPVGWSLCDGTNGTPDLRDKFVIGGGNLYNLGNNGGSTTTTITSTNQLPAHQHTITNIVSTSHTGHTHNTGSYSLATNGAHTHTFGSTTISTDGLHAHGCSTSYSDAGSHTHVCSTSYNNAGAHSFAMSGTTSSNGNHNHNNGEFNKVLRRRGDCCGTTDGLDCTGCAEPDIETCATMVNSGSHTHTWSTGTMNLAAHHHSVTCSTGGAVGSHNHGTTCNTANNGVHTHSIGGTTDNSITHSHTISGSSGNDGSHSHTSSGTTDPIGNGNTINILNPYYTAYYIMKIPYTFPTDNPTLSPTLSPSNAPSITPSNAPSLTPSNIPTNTPSIAPSIAPSITPSIAPTIVPSITPSIAPTFTPTISPTFTPTSPPSLSPSEAPTNTPTLSPAVNPTTSPSLFPTYSPTKAPSISPSISPTISPTITPSLAPSLSPTTPPSLSPSLIPSLIPSLSPSLSPTVSPSLSPTNMPTPICWTAKFKNAIIKSSNLGINDVLKSGQHLVSSNCRFLLTMNENGNLILSGLVGKYEDPFEKDENGVFTNNKNKMTIYNGWETNTTIENNSGESTAVMSLKDGTIIVEEYEFIGVPNFEPIKLWQSGEPIEENELILQLTDNGCVTLNEYYGSINTDHLIPFWFVCAQLENSRNDDVRHDDIIDDIEPSTTIETTTRLTAINNNNNEEYTINKDNIQLLTNWNIIISCILIVLLLGCLYMFLKRLYDNYQSTDTKKYNISSLTTIAHGISKCDDDDEQMVKEIELWSMETNNVATIMQQTTN